CISRNRGILEPKQDKIINIRDKAIVIFFIKSILSYFVVCCLCFVLGKKYETCVNTTPTAIPMYKLLCSVDLDIFIATPEIRSVINITPERSTRINPIHCKISLMIYSTPFVELLQF